MVAIDEWLLNKGDRYSRFESRFIQKSVFVLFYSVNLIYCRVFANNVTF